MHFNGATSYLFVNGTEVIKFKAKDSEIVASPFCLGNISKEWAVDNLKKTKFNRYFYDFSVDYDATDVGDFRYIHKYLMKQNNIVQRKVFEFVEKVFFVGLTILSSFTSASFVSYISRNNQACKARPQIVNVNSNNPIFYSFSIKTSKCSGNCNNINDPYSNVCVLDVAKNLNVRVFNVMSRTNETRHIQWQETCRLDAVVCNNK